MIAKTNKRRPLALAPFGRPAVSSDYRSFHRLGGAQLKPASSLAQLRGLFAKAPIISRA
jgi:hypothetical protein